MLLITNSELFDFEQCIDAANLIIDDFELTEQVDPDELKVGYFPTNTVTVTYTPTGVARSYDAGGGSIWPQVFEADLQAGNFGEP